ncbi:MAG TPA: hypothetical protein VGN48_15825 [Pedococcus sp.]|jgi:hypothetical protein|nr:hypothetical protein [Pedococcus sp.]
MGLFNPGSGTGGRAAKVQRLEMLLGFIGFFAVMAMINTVYLEVRGEQALGSALLLAALLFGLWLLWRARRNADV